MFDTYVTIVGNVLTAPEWRRTTGTQALVANFKVASTARRYDKESGRWVDGDSLRVRVTCWRRLAEGVASSIMVGDPVVLTGRMYTRDWTTEDGQRRLSYELEAVAVGHDLSRGRAKFLRTRAAAATSVVEDEESDNRVAGEPTEPVSPGTAAGGFPGEDAAAFEGLDPGMFGEFEPIEFDTSAEPNSVEAIAAEALASEELEDDSEDSAAEESESALAGSALAGSTVTSGRRGRRRETAHA